jgi:hypothetical protein
MYLGRRKSVHILPWHITTGRKPRLLGDKCSFAETYVRLPSRDLQTAADIDHLEAISFIETLLFHA